MNSLSWRWSSAASHVKCKDDIFVHIGTFPAMMKALWKKFLSVDIQESEMDLFRSMSETEGQWAMIPVLNG